LYFVYIKYPDFMRVYEVTTAEEKQQLDPIRLRSAADLLKKGDHELSTMKQ